MELEDALVRYDGLLNRIMDKAIDRYPSLRRAAMDRDDLKQLAAMELPRVLETHDPDKGTLENWLQRQVFRAIGKYVRGTGQTPTALMAKRRTPPGGSVFSIDRVPEPEITTADHVPDQIERMDLREALKKLTPAQRKLIEKRFGLRGKEKTQDEISEVMKISQSTVKRMELRAISKLRRMLE